MWKKSLAKFAVFSSETNIKNGYAIEQFDPDK